MSYWQRFLGLLSNNTTRFVRATNQSNLGVEIGGTGISTFGDLVTADINPLFQFDFVSQPVTAGTMTQLFGAFITNGGTAGTDAGRLKLTTSAGATGSSVGISNIPARSYAGQGVTARFSASFPNGGVATSTQVVGMCVPTITWTNNATAPGQPITAVAIGDGYFFGYNNTTFGIRHKNSRTASDTFVLQTAWNVDTCDGSGNAANPSGFNLNPTFGNIYQIRYPYLGSGDIQFFVENADTGNLILVHVIKFANTTAQLLISNPSLNFFAQVIKTAGATDINLFVGSAGAFLNGVRVYNGPHFGFDNRIVAIVNNTETPIFSLRNATSINGVPNRRVVRLRSVSFSVETGTTEARFRIRRNPALTGSTFATAIFGTITAASAGFILTAAQSSVTADTAATAVAALTAGASDIVFNAVVGQSAGFEVDLTPYNIFIVPGDTMTMTMIGFAGTPNVQVAVNWNEDT